METHSIPPNRLHAVAHSYPINLAAESGLLGLAGLAWLTITLAWHVWRTWGRLSPTGRATRVGAVAALISCAVHSQFDSVAGVPYIAFILAFLLALLLAPQPSPPSARQTARRRADAWLLPIGWGILVVTAVWSLRATLPFSRAIEAANAGHWEEAASLFDVAEQRDPALAYYDLQAGYAHGRLAAEGDTDHLDAALAHYEAGVRRSPNYGLNAAHLGALYRQAGDPDEAVAWTERAVDLAPRSALFALNLGRLYEELGQFESAERQYKKTLNRAPEWAEAAFWRATPLRQALADNWLANHPPPQPVEAPRSVREWSTVGRAALRAGRAAEALDAFEQAVTLNPHDVAAHVGQGRAYLALGQAAEAERVLHTALSGGVTLELDHARALALLAQIYDGWGEREKAIRALQAAISSGQQTLSQQPYVLGWRSYPNFLFYRESPEEHLLPQLAVITVTDEVTEWMLQLGAWHEEAGDRSAAREIYREVLEAAPDVEEAQQRLQALD
jgi:tetratricopeptide (TPR) repeat protein